MKKKLGVAAAAAGTLVTGVVVYMATPSDPAAVGVEPAVPCQFELPPMYGVGSAESGTAYVPPGIFAVETNSPLEVIQITGITPVDPVQNTQETPPQPLGPVDVSVSEQVSLPSSQEVQVEDPALSPDFQEMTSVDAVTGPEITTVIHNPVSVATNVPISRWSLVKGIGLHGSRAWALAREGERQELLGNREAADKLYMRLLSLAERFE